MKPRANMSKYLCAPVILYILVLISITSIPGSQPAAVQSSTVIVTYNPNEENIPNPERGFFTNFEPVWNEGPPEWTTDNPAITDANCQEALRYKYTVLRRWYVIDWDQRTSNLSSAFLQHVRDDFATVRRNGLKMILRFSYNYARGNYNGVSDTDINSVLTHLDQLEPLIQENEDVLAFMEAGFVGYWGEWHHSSNNLTVNDDDPDNDINDNSVKLIDKLLEVVPKTRMIALRVPYHKIQYLKLSNLSIDAMTAAEAYTQTFRARLGHHDDGFRANFNDWATYQGYPFYLDVEAWKNYMAEENRWVVQSGEPAGTGPGKQVDQSGPACIQDFERLHFNHFNSGVCPPNGNIAPFSSQSGCGVRMYEQWKADGSIPEMEKRLGYRFQLTRAELPLSAVTGTQTTIRFGVKNTGWATPYNPRGCEVIFRSQTDGTKLIFPCSSDPRKWSSGTEQIVTANITLPADIKAGNYDLFLHLPDPQPTLYGRPQYSIQLANLNVWDATTGYNSFQHTVNIVRGGSTPAPGPTSDIIPPTPSTCTHYLAPNGSDSTNGSLSSLWRTFTYASSRLRPGDVLCARGGTYTNQGSSWRSPSGRADAPITFRAYPGEKPIIDGQGSTSNGMNISTVDWIIIDGLSIRNYKGPGAIWLGYNGSGSDFAEHVALRNLTITDVGDNSWQDHGIYLSYGVRNAEVSGNYIRGASSAGIHLYHKPGVDGARIFNNVITKCARWGMVLRDGAQRLEIYNNTVVENGLIDSDGHEMDFGGTISARIVNNIFGRASVKMGSGVVADYNMLLTGTLRGEGTHSFVGNARFVNAAGGDYRLQSGSDAIDRGTTVDVQVDIYGVARPEGSGFDIGAVEYPSSTPTPTPTPAPLLTQTIELQKNWNLISLPINPKVEEIADVLSPINGQYEAVYAFNGKGYESYYPGNAAMSTLKKMQAGRGYWVYMNQAAGLQIKGTRAGRDITLRGEWNLVGFNSTESISATHALASTKGKVLVVYAYDRAENEYRTVNSFQPFEGYWMYASEGTTWTLPDR
jgi:hypothetical protein